MDHPEPLPTDASPPPAAHRMYEAGQALAEVVLCSGVPTQLAIGALLRAGGMAAQHPDGSLSAVFVFTLSLADTALLLGLIAWLLIRRGERPMAVWFGGRAFLPEAVFGLLSLPAVLAILVVVSVAVQAAAPWLHNVANNPIEGLLGTQAGLLMFVAVAIVAGGLREELQRAFLLHRFRTSLGGPAVGLVVTSAAFGLGHTLQGWDATIITGLLGALWGAMYFSRGGAAAAIVSHSLFNSTELVRAFFT